MAGHRVMNGIRTFLEEALKLRVNPEKSAVARPWERKFLGYRVTVHHETRLRIAPASVQRLTQKVRDLMCAGRGRSLARTIEDLNPLLRRWINYFKLTQIKGVLEELDSWMRRRRIRPSCCNFNAPSVTHLCAAHRACLQSAPGSLPAR